MMVPAGLVALLLFAGAVVGSIATVLFYLNWIRSGARLKRVLEAYRNGWRASEPNNRFHWPPCRTCGWPTCPCCGLHECMPTPEPDPQ